MATIQPDSIDGRGFKGGLGVPQSDARDLLALAKGVVFSAIAAQEGRMVIWAPVFLMVGIWGYFNLSVEPGLIAVLFVLVVALLLLLAGRRLAVLLGIGLVLLGFGLAKLRQETVATPLLRASVATSAISGFVADADNRGNGQRVLVVELDSATNIPAGEVPRRLRITTYDAPNALIGDYVRMTARLNPLPTPVLPGGYDFGRDLYFQSVGAMGRNIEPPVFEDRPVPWKFVERRLFHKLRSIMGARITAVIPGPIGAFANSIITGERGSIPKDMNTSLQISGLAHIISISGLHMSLVAGGVFWVMRAFLALFPRLALNYPIKKWSAVAALVVGLIYMLLADSGSATERSYIMIAVMFFAILVDRPALSMRNLALAALIILLVSPEQAVGASFQMSFLAVMGLVAFFEHWNNRPVDAKALRASRAWRFSAGALKLFLGSVLTTVVAGGLSSIAAVYHFGRLSPYGTIANALALPIADLLVMPAAMLGVLLMPFGLDYWPFKLVQWGLEATMWISDTIMGWPSANLMVVHPTLSSVAVMVMGAVLMCLLAGRVRWLGVPVLALGMYLGHAAAPPHILIDDRASNVAILNDAQKYVLADSNSAKFSAEKWLQFNGETESTDEAAARAGWTCMEGMCFSDLLPKSVALIHEQADADWQCPPVDIVIADFPLREACAEAKLRIDRFDVWRDGATAIYLVGDQIRIETTRAAQGQRPWVLNRAAGDRARFASNVISDY